MNGHSWIEINRSALINNINQIKKFLRDSKLSVVVKSNGYGHGLIEMGLILENVTEVYCLCTAGIEEALKLRAAGITKKILVLAYYDAPLKEAINNNIDLIFYDISRLNEINKSALEVQKKVKIHLKIETGLGRLGIKSDSIVNFLEELKKYPNIELFGVCTHLSDTCGNDLSYAYEQLDIFNKILKQIRSLGFSNIFSHALSSGGISIGCASSNLSKLKHDLNNLDKTELSEKFLINKNPNLYEYSMVRAGTNIYGLWKSEAQKNRMLEYDPTIKIDPILTWKTKIIDIVKVNSDEPIGYLRTYIAKYNMKVAIISAGYADGYPRILSNKSVVLVNGQYAPVIGLISMNIMAIDVTNIPTAQIGNEVILLGNHEKILANDLAQLAQTTNLEILTKINPEIKRIIVNQEELPISKNQNIIEKTNLKNYLVP